MFHLLVLISSYQVNAISFHPVHGTLATVGSDGRFSFWDKDARTKLKTSEQLDQPITACCFNHNGNIFAYASSYDWSKVTQLFFSILLYSTVLPAYHTLLLHTYYILVLICSVLVVLISHILWSEFLRATSTTTPRKRTTSSWGTLPRSWSLGTRNGERRAASVYKPGDWCRWTGLPYFLSARVTHSGAFKGTPWSLACM